MMHIPDAPPAPRYWTDKRIELLPLVEQLTPDDALCILRSLVDGAWEENQIAPTLVGLIHGTLQRRADTAKVGQK